MHCSSASAAADCRIDKHRNHGGFGHRSAEKLQALCPELARTKGYAGDVAARPVEAGDEAKPHRVGATVKTIGIVAVAALAAMPSVTAGWQRSLPPDG